ncbi:MAG: ion transporter [Bacteroidales bacterium]|nr:ion transporter [Bacteroidales bacterium]
MSTFNYQNTAKRAQEFLNSLIFVNFLGMILFWFVPAFADHTDETFRPLRILFYLIADFSFAFFTVEILTRLVFEDKNPFKFFYADYRIRIWNCIDFLIFLVVFLGVFNGHIELYGIRIVRILRISLMKERCGRIFLKLCRNKISFERLQKIIETGSYRNFHKRIEKKYFDISRREKYLRWIVILNLLCFILIFFDSVRNCQGIVGVRFVIDFIAFFSSLIYVFDILDKMRRLREEEKITAKFSLFKRFIKKDKWNFIDICLTVISLLVLKDLIDNILNINEFSKGILAKETLYFHGSQTVLSRIAMTIKPFIQLRIFRVVENLRKITRTLVQSFTDIVWALVYFAVLFFIYGTIGHSLFQKSEYFCTLSESIRTLFRVMTFESWGGIMNLVIDKCTIEDSSPEIVEMLIIGYFYSFIILVSYIMWSVIQGIIVDKVRRTEQEIIEEKPKNKTNSDIKEQLELVTKELDKLKTMIEQEKQIV